MICKIVKSFVLLLEHTTHYGLNLDDVLWVLGFLLSTVNTHQRKTTLLDSHSSSAYGLFLKASNSEEKYKTVYIGVKSSNTFGDFSFVLRCATLFNEVL